MKKILLFSIICFALSGCNNKATEGDPDVENPDTSTPIPSPTLGEALPAMPQDELVAIFHAVDDVDILFLEKGISMNSAGNMAKASVQYISLNKADRVPCNELCYMFFKSQGEQIAHFGAYWGGDCAYFILYEDNKPKYANLMTQTGIDFFNKIATQISTAPQ